MSPRIAAVLLVPAEGDPLGLLTPNCGAWPPAAWIHADAPHPWVLRGLPEDAEDFGDALVLAWGGKVVAEGCDRADWRRMLDPNGYPARNVYPEAARLLMWSAYGDDLSAAGCVQQLRLITRDLGTLIFFDADGREVTL